LQRTKSISIFVSGSFPCPEVDNEANNDISKLIQISFGDIKKLIGNSALGQTEHGFAEILIDAQ